MIGAKPSSLYTKASRKIRKLESTEDFYEIEKCEGDLREFLENAVNAKEFRYSCYKRTDGSW